MGRLHRRGASARPAADHRARSRRAGTRSRSPPASTGRPWACSSASGSSTRPSAATAAPSTARQGARARVSAAPRCARWARAAALRPGARSRVGRPGASSRALLRIPLGADAGLRARGPPAPARVPASRAACSSRTRSRRRRCGAPERARDKLFRYPGLKEDYYLADFEPDRRSSTSSGIDADRVLVVVRPPPETSAYHAANPLYEQVLDRLAADPRRHAVRDPAHRGPGGADRAPPGRRADRPGRGRSTPRA